MFKTNNALYHTLTTNVDTVRLPEAFTFPFYYQPHTLSKLAAKEVQDYLENQTDFDHNFGLNPTKNGLVIGKMFGVMIVQSKTKKLGYIVAFSGKLAESNYIKGFVPPIFDTLKEDGFYKKGEAYLNTLNHRISALESDEKFIAAKTKTKDIEKAFEIDLNAFKQKVKAAKKERDRIRVTQKSILDEKAYTTLLENLKKESIYNHFRLRDLKNNWAQKIKDAKEKFEALRLPIDALKKERKALSSALQKQLHNNYNFLNYNGATKDLISIFKATNLMQPPAGAGECAAPKLFQFAYENELKPIAMAEFWWGSSPKSEIRKHKQFYPSCRGKCEPILGHMMQGLTVAPNPLENSTDFKGELEIVYEDDFLLAVNKPHEFLSVPGKTILDSVHSRMQDYLLDATGTLLVHRLDMSTSGLLLVAKNEKTHKNLQKQFIERSIKKRYVAILDGELQVKNGLIDLPLRVDFNNRPRQLVCEAHGKSAQTKYKVICIENNKTRIYFHPITGRTHQLRVHAAHHLGLNIPILGDDLYGIPADRLYLHAETLQFEHPVLKKEIILKCDTPF